VVRKRIEPIQEDETMQSPVPATPYTTSQRVRYISDIPPLLVGEGCDLTAAYERCLAIVDDGPFIPNSNLMADLSGEMFRCPAVLARRLQRMSEHETSGARIIERVATGYADGQLRSQLLAHAEDEYRHGRMLGGFSAKVAGEADMRAPVVESLSTEEHAAQFNGNLQQFLLATHIAELRNLALLSQYRAASAIASENLRAPLLSLFTAISKDEARHVAYTGLLVNDIVARDVSWERMFREYVAVYDRQGWAEVEMIASLFAGQGGPD
jgi:hypothetical protein